MSADTPYEHDERPVFQTRLHPVALAGTATFAVFVAAVTALIVRRNPLAPQVVTQLWIAAAITVVLAAGPPLLRWRGSLFSVTNRRLLIREGGLRRRTHAFRLADVTDLQVERTLLGRVLDYGTLRVVDANGTPETFARVAAPDGLRDAVVSQSRSGRRKLSG